MPDGCRSAAGWSRACSWLGCAGWFWPAWGCSRRRIYRSARCFARCRSRLSSARPRFQGTPRAGMPDPEAGLPRPARSSPGGRGRIARRRGRARPHLTPSPAGRATPPSPEATHRTPRRPPRHRAHRLRRASRRRPPPRPRTGTAQTLRASGATSRPRPRVGRRPPADLRARHPATTQPGRRVMAAPRPESGKRTRVPRRIWSPPGHWRLLALCLFVVLVVLTFQGISAHTIGATAEPHDGSGAPAPLAHARPLLAARGDRLVSVERPPGRRVALTFDDGPDPRWTPRIAAVLRAAHVPGTFFVVGSQAARHPGLVRQLVRQGVQPLHAAVVVGQRPGTRPGPTRRPALVRRSRGLRQPGLAAPRGAVDRRARHPTRNDGRRDHASRRRGRPRADRGGRARAHTAPASARVSLRSPRRARRALAGLCRSGGVGLRARTGRSVRAQRPSGLHHDRGLLGICESNVWLWHHKHLEVRKVKLIVALAIADLAAARQRHQPVAAGFVQCHAPRR